MEIILLAFSVGLLGYFFLLLVLPKGNPLHEIMRLPPYWVRLLNANRNKPSGQKISYGPHPRQYILYFPNPSTHRKEVIIYFHGGGWRIGAPENFLANAHYFNERGFVAFLPSYRRVPEYNYEDIRQDLQQVLQKIEEILVRDGYQKFRFIFGGMSAGGNLSALMALDWELLGEAGFTPQKVAGLFLLGAPLNLAMMMESPPVRRFAGPRKAAMFQRANPITYLDKKPQLPVLCIHGERDGMVEYDSVVSFVERWKQLAPEQVDFFPIPKGTHLDAGRWFYKNSPIYYKIEEWLNQHFSAEATSISERS